MATWPVYVAVIADFWEAWATKLTQAIIIPRMIPVTKSQAPIVTTITMI